MVTGIRSIVRIINEVRSIAMALVIAAPAISFADAGTALSEKDKSDFIRQGIPSCINGQNKHPVAKFVDQNCQSASNSFQVSASKSFQLLRLI